MGNATRVDFSLGPGVARERGWAALWSACTILAIAGLLSLSSWTRSGPQSGVFVSIVGGLTAIAYLAVAYLLSNRLVISRSPALAVLASTYVLCGLAVGVYTLTFPGVAPEWWRHGPETARWFWVLWHGAAAAGIIGFVALDDEWTTRQRRVEVYGAPDRAILARLSLGDAGAFLRGPFFIAILAVAGSAVWVWREPNLFASWFGAGAAPPVAVSVLLILDIAAIVLLAVGLQRENLIRTWLLLGAIASAFDVAAMAWSTGPFTMGWYFSKACGLVAASVLPIVLFGDLRTRLALVELQDEVDSSLLDPETGAVNERGWLIYHTRMAQLAVQKGVPLTIAVARVERPSTAMPVLRRLFRATDVIGRVEANEFAIILTPGSDASAGWLRRRLHDEERRGAFAGGNDMALGLGSCDPSKPRPADDVIGWALQSARSAIDDRSQLAAEN